MKVKRQPDPRYSSIRVDTHFFDNSIGLSERQAADELLKLAYEDLSIAVPHSVRTELDHPNTPEATRMRAGDVALYL